MQMVPLTSPRLLWPAMLLAVIPAPLWACSGPGAGEAMMKATAFGFVSAMITAAILIPTILLHAKLKPGIGWVFYLALIAIHPAWTVSAYGGDCGGLRGATSLFFTAVAAICLLVVCARFVASRGRPRSRIPKATWVAAAMLAAVPCYVMTLPWTLHPTPWQVSAVGRRLAGLPDAQREFATAKGSFASSEDELDLAGTPFRKKEAGYDRYVANADVRPSAGEFAIAYSGEIFLCRIAISKSGREQKWAVHAWPTNQASEKSVIYMTSEGEVYYRSPSGESAFKDTAWPNPFEPVPSEWRKIGQYRKMTLEEAGRFHGG